MAEVGAWQARPLGPMYPVVFFDALRVKIREDAVVRNKATRPALADIDKVAASQLLSTAVMRNISQTDRGFFSRTGMEVSCMVNG